MSIVGAFILPHPPIILHEIGKGKEKEIQKTIDACTECARRIAELKPDVIVVTSPHSVMYADYFHISPGKGAKGDMGRFGAPQASIQVEYDVRLVTALQEEVAKANVSAGTLGEEDPKLDHGTIVPLSFVNAQYQDYQLVRIGLSGLPYADHYKFGRCIAAAANGLDKRVVFLASGDLSHKVSEDGPYGYAKEGVEFDKEVTAAMADADFLKFLSFPPSFAEAAAECGLRSFLVMAGALDRVDVKAELLSYEGTFGVGYGVASFLPTGENAERAFLELFEKEERKRLEERKAREDEYVKLARRSLEHYIKTGKRAKLPTDLPEDLTSRKAGVFVSLKKQGNLRGCIGTIMPVTGSVAEEILKNAVSAAVEDYRFSPVREDELDSLVYSVDVLSPPEPVESKEELDVKRYGVIVTSGRKRGLLLPNLDGIDTVEEQIKVAMQKAGIRKGEKIGLERFEVIRHV